MRNISFSITTKQIKNRTKTVTRRLGWKHLKMGEQLCAVEKAMGLKKGEKIKKLTIIEVEQHSFEPLNTITQQEVINEGFPGMTPEEFIEMFCATHKNCKPHTTVTRIQFKYV